MQEQEVQIMFGDCTIKVVAEPHGLFRLLKALKADGHDPQVRYHDEELRGLTCWQPTSKAA